MPGLSFFDSKECEWIDMEISVEGAPLTKIRGLKYKAVQEKELLHGAGDEPLSVQRGPRTYEGEIKILKGALDSLNLAAIAAGGRDALDLEFNIGVSYAKTGIRPLQKDALIGCQIKEIEKGWEQGAKFMEVTLPIVFLRLASK